MSLDYEEISDEEINKMPVCELMLYELKEDAGLMSWNEFEYDLYNWMVKHGEDFKAHYLTKCKNIG